MRSLWPRQHVCAELRGQLTVSGTKPSESSPPMLKTESSRSESILAVVAVEENVARVARRRSVDTASGFDNAVGHEKRDKNKGRLSRVLSSDRAQSREKGTEEKKCARLAVDSRSRGGQDKK